MLMLFPLPILYLFIRIFYFFIPKKFSTLFGLISGVCQSLEYVYYCGAYLRKIFKNFMLMLLVYLCDAPFPS